MSNIFTNTEQLHTILSTLTTKSLGSSDIETCTLTLLFDEKVMIEGANLVLHYTDNHLQYCSRTVTAITGLSVLVLKNTLVIVTRDGHLDHFSITEGSATGLVESVSPMFSVVLMSGDCTIKIWD